MKPINTPEDFAALLQADQAIVFLFFEWSCYADLSRRVLEQWEQESASRPGGMDFVIHELSVDKQPFAWKWINTSFGYSQECEHGYGSVVWLNKGVVVGYVKSAADAGIKTLSRISNDCFALGKVLDSSAIASLQNEPPPFDVELLKILCCPETHQKLQLATPPLLEKLNRQISAGRLQNRSGQTIEDRVDAGLVRADGRYLYPLRQNIPVLLVDEAIPLSA